MTVTVPAAVFQELVLSVDKGIYNRGKSVKLDRKAMPLLDFWMGRKKEVNASQGVVRVNLQVSDSTPNQGWTQQDVLSFNQNFPALGFEFGIYNVHRGLIFVHDDLMNEGYEIDFNDASDKVATPLSASESTRLRNILADKLDNYRDAFNVALDQNLSLDGTQDAKLPIGLDAMIPLANTGNYGGLSRTDPRIQPFSSLAMTYGAGGTARSALNTAVYQAKLNSRGAKRGKYRFIVGRGFADRYASYATANSWQVHTMATGTKDLDISISDSGLQYLGVPLEINPTFDLLDAAYAPAIPWTRRGYFLCEDTFILGTSNGKSEPKMSVPPDPAEVRVTRCSLDWRLSPFCTNPNANAVVAFVA